MQNNNYFPQKKKKIVHTFFMGHVKLNWSIYDFISIVIFPSQLKNAQ